MNTLRRCDACDRPATAHEVERVGDQRVAHHLCDEHVDARQRALGRPLVRAVPKFDLPRFLADYVDQHREASDWPRSLVVASGLLAEGAGPCVACGGPASQRHLDVARDGAVVRDVAYCAAHAAEAGEPVIPARVSSP